MAMIQPPASSDSILTAGAQLPFIRHRVAVAPSWTADWEPADYMECLGLTWCASPGISTAQMVYHAGSIKREDRTEFEPYEMKNLSGWFVKVELLNPSAEADDRAGNEDPIEVLETWYGQILLASHSMNGAEPDADNIADQSFTAYGIEHVLDKIKITGSFVLGHADDGIRIDTPIAFNQRLTWGPGESGNRSGSAVELDGPDVTAYVFDGSMTGGEEWTVFDAVQYLLAFFAPSEAEGGPVFDLAGQAEELRNVPVRDYHPAGRTLKTCLDELINPARGFGWCLRTPVPTEDEEESVQRVQIHVFTVTITPVGMSDYTLPANPEQAIIDLSGALEVEEAIVNEDMRDTFGTVIVQGQRLLVCATFGIADGTLEKGWTTDEETSYVNATGVSNDQRDKNRQVDSLRHVFQLLRVPQTWDYTTGDGAGGEKHNANPLIKEDGHLDTEQQAPVRSSWGLTFERNLPLFAPRLIDGLKPDYQDALGWVTDPAGEEGDDFVQLDALPSHLRLLDNDLGVLLTTNPAHLLAKNHVSTILSDQQPVYDYETVAITAAWRTDQALRVVVYPPIPPRANESSDAWDARRALARTQVLTIDLPGAQMHYVVPGTAISATELHAGGIVRDDGDLVRRVATGAASWFGRVRASLTLRVARMMLWPAVGSIVERYDEGTDRFAIETVLTERQIDLVQQRTAIKTSFVELELG